MFGNTSRTFSSTNIYNESLAAVTYSVANTCASTTGISQSISARGANIKGCSISQSSNSKVNFSCLQSVSFGAEFQTKFANTFKERLNSEVAALGLGAFNTAESISLTNLTNRISSSIDVSAVSSCINSHITQQTIMLDGATVDCTSGGDIAQNATLEMLASCKQLNSTTTSALAEIDNLIDKKLAASSSFPTWLIVIIVAILGLGLLAGLFFVLRGSSRSGAEEAFDEFMASV